MNPYLPYYLHKLKAIHFKLTGSKVRVKEDLSYDLYGQDASDAIKRLLLSDRPAMIARFGSGELQCTKRGYLKLSHSLLRNSFNYIKGKSDAFWWTDEIRKSMSNNAGFFPPTDKNLERFTRIMLNDMKELDLLGSWLQDETCFKKQLRHAVKAELPLLEPYYHAHPWSKALEGKKVLVVHPYSKSITNQYNKRELLFKDKNVLPQFNLVTIRAIQSIAGSDTGFKDWFKALDHMKAQIDKTDFDIAIIGCGAYGFPLAAHVKRIGKKGVHLGGATQVLFGIKGKRWEDMDFFKNLFNEHWVRPLEEETPANNKSVENGCYW